MATLPQQISELLNRVVNQIIFLEKRSVFEHGDLKLYPSEIHLMQLIYAKQATNATGMARRLGVSKGAISQTLSRLEKKGIITKSKDPANKNELTAMFTPKGLKAMQGFEEVRSSLRKPYAKYLTGLSTQEGKVIIEFLEQSQRMLSRLG